MGKYIVHKAVEIDAVQKKRRKSLADYEATYLMQPKYDGCNVSVKCYKSGEFEVLTRTGETVRSMDHIATLLDDQQYALISASEDGLVFLGEAWWPGRDQQPLISGSVRRHEPDFKLDFIVFDVLTIEEFEQGWSTVPYHCRIARYLAPLNGGEGEKVRKALTIPAGALTVEKLQTELDMSGGYDGVILRDPDGTWTAGSGTTGEIIKVKPTVTYDLEVIGVEEGLGKLAGMAGKLVFRWTNDRVVKAIGGSFADRKRWFDDPSLITGTIWELEAMGLTPDGMLREPRVKTQRFDKAQADA